MSERIITFGEATREAMFEEMRADERVFVYGEDIAKQGGIFGQFAGMKDEFPERVLDTPISETALVGAGVGAAIAGAKPVIDLHFADFIGIAMDEVLNQMAKAHYMFGGQATMSLVLRARRPDEARRRPAFPVAGDVVHQHPRHPRGRALDAGQRQAAAQGGHQGS